MVKSKRRSLKSALERIQSSSKKRKLDSPSTAAANGAEDGRMAKKAKPNPSVAKSQANQQPVIPFAQGESVLLVGEGDFTFTLALLSHLSSTSATDTNEDGADEGDPRILATTFDSLAILKEKYPTVEETVKSIEERGGKCVFGVDATKLEKYKEVKRKGGWDKIVFNFPHSGSSIADQDRNVRTNQSLILLFLRSGHPLLRPISSTSPSSRTLRRTPTPDSDVEPSLSPVSPARSTSDPCILITLFTGSPYTLWSLPDLAKNKRSMSRTVLEPPLNGLKQPTYEVRRSFRFPAQKWGELGYAHQRTNPNLKDGRKKGKVGGGEGEARTWVLVPREEKRKEDESD
ncbi:hypothetical protein BT69DRAFT_1256176 [Atractiella rhizophila]|nr:hypothetical protein BT69DRAFT_1256176 [Atractiella rhizophila]